MLKQRFYIFILATLVEAWLFSIMLFSGSFFFAGFFGLLLVRRLMISYRIDKIAKENGLV